MYFFLKRYQEPVTVLSNKGIKEMEKAIEEDKAKKATQIEKIQKAKELAENKISVGLVLRDVAETVGEKIGLVASKERIEVYKFIKETISQNGTKLDKLTGRLEGKGLLFLQEFRSIINAIVKVDKNPAVQEELATICLKIDSIIENNQKDNL